jgi:tetratricopeptide (TPR) repeat protein
MMTASSPSSASSASNTADLAPLLERVRVFGQSGAENPMKPTFKADALLALSEGRLRAGDAEQARIWADRAVDTLGDFARQGAGLRLAAMSRMLTGISLLQQGHAEQALSWLRRAQGDYAKAVGPEHLSTQIAALNTAIALDALQRTDDAIAMIKHAEPTLRAMLGPDAPTYKNAIALLTRLENQTVAFPQKGPDTALSARGFFR